MTAFEAIAKAELEITAAIERSRKAEGLDTNFETTGKVFVDSINEAVWFEIRADGFLCFASLDYPEAVAHGEKIVVVEDTEEALQFGDTFR